MSNGKQPPLEGRAALVTGAGRGLGRAYAVALARHGASVAVNSRSQEAVAEVVGEITQQGGRAIGCAGDLEGKGVPEDIVDAAVRAFGHLDILVNNAGGDAAQRGSFTELTRADRDAMMRNNFDTAWDLTAAAWAHLAASGSGRIVLTSSALAFYAQPGFAHYAAAKGAVVGLARTLAAEGREHGLTVNVLNPLANTRERPGFTRWPASRFAAEHVAEALAWMTSERCTMTGQIISAGGTRMAIVSITENTGYVGATEFEHPDDVDGAVEDILHGGRSHAYLEMADFAQYLDQIYGQPDGPARS
jgi:NAD(P)-dependent dehydrogenase (short-subunit alcohol dehydrogenase family)